MKRSNHEVDAVTGMLCKVSEPQVWRYAALALQERPRLGSYNSMIATQVARFYA